jgi:tRNA(adenine34) deaminase
MGGLDEFYMGICIQLAEEAMAQGQRPFGAVVVDPKHHASADYDRIISFGWGTGHDLDPIAHSEILAIQRACFNRRQLCDGLTLYSTHEPCPMCAGAINHANMKRVVWGSMRTDLPTLFRAKNVYRTATAILLDSSHPPDIATGVLRDDCCDLFANEVAQQLIGGGR